MAPNYLERLGRYPEVPPPSVADMMNRMSVERPTRTLRKLLHSHGYHALSASQYDSLGNADTFWLHSSMSAPKAK